MNKNKIIFLVVLGIIIAGIILLLMLPKSDPQSNKNPSARGVFNIWIYNDAKDPFDSVLADFKAFNPDYKESQFNVVSFSSYEEYYLALASAISKGESPDVFVLNNNEKNSIFSEQVYGIPSEIISPNDFRKKYKGLFGDDLIVTYKEGEEIKEILQGVAVGYESLGLYFNRRYVNSSDLKNISALNNKIRLLKKSNQNLIPFALGNGSTVVGASDILTQLFLFEDGITSLGDLAGNKAKEAIATYLLYGDTSGDNRYDSRFVELSTTGKNNFDLFSKGETFIIAGYPRDLEKIQEKGYSKNLLLASPFPHYFSGGGKTLANYNFFAINKESQKKELGYNLLQYLSTDRGAEKYLEAYSYYLPALLSIESDKLEEKVSDDFNITLGDFYDPNYELGSFDKGVKIIYDREVRAILDNSANYINSFEDLRAKLVCQSRKLTDLSNISNKCE